jgi:hypothetical protein
LEVGGLRQKIRDKIEFQWDHQNVPNDLNHLNHLNDQNLQQRSNKCEILFRVKK